MAISRRAFGVGLLAASATATGGYVYLRQHPEIAGRFGEPRRLFGFAGGEKEGFLANARVRDLLERRVGLILDARRAGSVAVGRQRTLLDQQPQILLPSLRPACSASTSSCWIRSAASMAMWRPCSAAWDPSRPRRASCSTTMWPAAPAPSPSLSATRTS